MTDICRTRHQERANDLDLDLFRLAARASDFACKDQTHRERERAEWSEIANALMRVRPMIRRLMHETDLERTR